MSAYSAHCTRGRIANHGGQFRQAGERVHGNNAVDHFAGEQLQARGRAGQIRPGVTQQNAVAILLRLFFYPLHHLGAKGLAILETITGDHIAAGGSQLTRQQVRLIVALFDRLQHALTVLAFTVSLLFSTRDTVATETPARRAIF